jgi:hypothetical protein
LLEGEVKPFFIKESTFRCNCSAPAGLFLLLIYYYNFSGIEKLNHNNLTAKLLLGIAALALGQAIQNGDGSLTTPAIIWLTIALICAGASLVSSHLSFLRITPRVLWAVLAVGLAWQIFQLFTSLPGVYILSGYHDKLWQFQICVLVGGICALLSLAPGAWFPLRVRTGLIALVFFAVLAAGVWVIRASPRPFIDTFMFQQTSSKALLEWHNPYELTHPNMYGDMAYYGPAWIKDGKLTIGNPYPPLSIFLSFLGNFIAGDIRYSHLAAILVGGALMASLRPGRGTLLAAYIFLFTPRLFFVLEQSWTEPLVLMLFVAVVWCALYRPDWRFIALGLLIASKQYMIFIFPLIFLLIPPASSRRFWAQASGWTVAIAFAVTAPLAFWNIPAFIWNVGLAQLYQVFRTDSLSYVALYAKLFGQEPSQLISFIVLCAALLLFWRFGTRSPAVFASAVALCLGLFFAFSKQAFCNYYFLVVGILCCAMALLPAPDNLFTTERITDSV